jgi:NTE family protein
MHDENKSFEVPDVNSPTTEIGHPSDAAQPQEGSALCLSGGGFRAMVFHAGVLLRLNELGRLNRLDRISSVSGGSITAGVLGLNWNRLTFDSNDVALNFRELVLAPILKFASHTIDTGSILSGVLGPGTVADKIVNEYRKHLFGNATLQDLPDFPRFVINATNVQSKALWRFSKPFMWDWRVGKVAKPSVEIAVAVGASSAFPPVLSPVELELNDSDFEAGTGDGLQRPPFTTKVILTDGGVYDNLGLETAWKSFKQILVSDAGGVYGAEEDPDRDWFNHTRRVYDLIDNQVRSLRKRQVIEAYKQKVRTGTYWGIWSDIRKYPAQNTLPCPIDKTAAIAGTPTRLKSLEESLRRRLINWGYAICDAGIRAHVDSSLPAPTGFPLPGGMG